MNGRSPRFSHWVAFLVFSTVTLGSVVQVVKSKNAYREESKIAERWAIAFSIITFITTLAVVGMHFHSAASTLIVGTKIEGAISLFLAIFWVVIVSLVTDSRRGLAVDEYGAVENGNLYYFSWAGFICSVTLIVSFLRHVFGVDIAGEIRSRSARLTTWSALLATSLVVMGSSANFFDTMCGGQDDYGKCSRAVFGIVLGAMSTLMAVAVVGMKIATTSAPFLMEAGLAFVLVTLYGFGVVFITSEKGPGAPLGNLYYFTWGSFIASFMLVVSCFEDYNSVSASPESPRSNGGDGGVDSQGQGSPSSLRINTINENATGTNHVILSDLEASGDQPSSGVVGQN